MLRRVYLLSNYFVTLTIPVPFPARLPSEIVFGSLGSTLNFEDLFVKLESQRLRIVLQPVGLVPRKRRLLGVVSF